MGNRLKIVGGLYSGRFLNSPDNKQTHPMSEKMRGAIFNVLGDISGLTTLDAFAGSGALGLEALSRGSAHVTFVERDKKALNAITHNIKHLGIQKANYRLLDLELKKALSVLGSNYFDLVFCDPPYSELQLQTIQDLTGHLKANSILVLSLPSSTIVPEFAFCEMVSNKKYGEAQLVFYRKIV